MRLTAFFAPLCMMAYGIARWIDGWDGDRGNGPAWDIGHTLFFIGMALFAVLAIQIRTMMPTRHRVVATAAAAAAVFGAGCFLWVIVGDLFRAFHDNFPLPDALETV